MSLKSLVVRSILIVLIFYTLLGTSWAVTGNFKDYSWISLIDQSSGRPIHKPLGKVILKNDKGEIIAEDDEASKGRITVIDSFLAVKGKEGTSFVYESPLGKINFPEWKGKNQTKFSKLRLVRQNLWLIEDKNFFFLVSISGDMLSRTYTICIPESIVRASVIKLSPGEYELFGYAIKASKDGASIKFSHGNIIENNYCTIEDLKQKNTRIGSAHFSLRYDGLYREIEKDDPKYLRFYTDGTVIDASTPDHPEIVWTWLNKQCTGASKGRYTIQGNHIIFTTTSNNGSVDYEGVIEKDGLTISSYSHINKYRAKRKFSFVKF